MTNETARLALQTKYDDKEMGGKVSSSSTASLGYLIVHLYICYLYIVIFNDLLDMEILLLIRSMTAGTTQNEADSNDNHLSGENEGKSFLWMHLYV